MPHHPCYSLQRRHLLGAASPRSNRFDKPAGSTSGLGVWRPSSCSYASMQKVCTPSFPIPPSPFIHNLLSVSCIAHTLVGSFSVVVVCDDGALRKRKRCLLPRDCSLTSTLSKHRELNRHLHSKNHLLPLFISSRFFRKRQTYSLAVMLGKGSSTVLLIVDVIG